MALLDMLVKADYHPLVCHVNYNMRPTSLRDQQIVENYCTANNLKLYTLSDIFNQQENFENYARHVRYRFFNKIYHENQADVLVVAHQMDDDLETYMMQKRRTMIPGYYGLAETVYHHDMKIMRPLLGYTKKDLEKYCEDHEIATGFDESNNSDQFTRNRLRKEIAVYSDAEKKALLEQAKEDNKALELFRKEVQEYKDACGYPVNVEKYHEIPQNYRIYMLRLLLIERDISVHRFSRSFLLDLDRKITQKNRVIEISHQGELHVEYGCFTISQGNDEAYRYQLDELSYFTCKHFTLSNSGKLIEGVNVETDDFPLIIRNAKPQDVIQMRFGKKQINRFFIDRKIPREQRKSWLVIENSRKEVIFVSKLGCNVTHYSNKPNLYVIK